MVSPPKPQSWRRQHARLPLAAGRDHRAGRSACRGESPPPQPGPNRRRTAHGAAAAAEKGSQGGNKPLGWSRRRGRRRNPARHRAPARRRSGYHQASRGFGSWRYFRPNRGQAPSASCFQSLLGPRIVTDPPSDAGARIRAAKCDDRDAPCGSPAPDKAVPPASRAPENAAR